MEHHATQNFDAGRSIVVAVGGNAIIQEKQKGTVDEQLENIRQISQPIASLFRKGYRIVLTHGNGPHVGNLLVQSEAVDHLPKHPLDVCDALTQGLIGYLLQQSLHNVLTEYGLQDKICTVVTQVQVAEDDPAFLTPTKPIGQFFSQEQAREMMEQRPDIVMREDAGRGYRRVVPSPQPLHIIESRCIDDLMRKGYLVIAAGGGGIPVVKRDGQLCGVEAVIDKDASSAFLANEIAAERLVLLTGVDQVCVRFGKPDQRALSHISVEEAQRYLDEGEFPVGSMGPKIQAAIDFVRAGGKEAIITSLSAFESALEGNSGTIISR